MLLKKLGKFLGMFLFCVILSSCGKGADNKVALLQIVEHPALDKTKAGIESTLSEAGIKVDFESAQGNPVTAVQIANKFKEKKYPVIVTIGTLAAQSAIKNSDVPVVYSSVTDPKLLGDIVDGAVNVEGKAINIAGVSNFVPIEPQLAFYKKLMPNAQHFGVIYNVGEPNSVKIVDSIQSVAHKFNIKVTAISATSTNDIPAAVNSLIANKVNAIWINNDNTALSAIQTIVKIAKEAKIPVFCSDIDTVGMGVFAAIGPDQFNIGVETGKIVIDILKNKKSTKEIAALEAPKTILIKIDESAASEFAGISLSEEVIKMNNTSVEL